MARKKTTRRLPPLPSKPVLHSREHKTERLAEILRSLAVKSQSESAKNFYSIREVAKRFRVSSSVVGNAYAQLEAEGLLASLPGSKTLLQGFSSVRQLNVLGFIGMPAAISAFVALQDYRTFFVRLRRELRARGFAVGMVLFNSSDIKSGKLLSRIYKYKFDALLWYRPDASAGETISRLKDKGVGVIAVKDHHLSPSQNRYEIRREDAITQVFHYWRTKAHIESAVIVRGTKAAASEEILERLLEQEHFRFDLQSADNKSAASFLKSLGRVQTRGIIFPSWAASMFAFRDPEGLMQLAERCHVAFTDGPPTIPFAQVRDVRAELVVIDWQLVAEKIVSDLISKKAFERGEPTIFAAQAHIRALLSQYSQMI